MAEFPPQLPHGTLHEVLPGVFVVSGQVRPNFNGQDLQFSRNMTVIRDGDALTLVNTLRMDETGLAELDRLGTVKNVARIGAFHGRDDAFYIDRYGANFWASPEFDYQRGEKVDTPLTPGISGPAADCDIFVFETANTPEVILKLNRHGGILISCDSLQNWMEVDEFFDEKTGKTMTERGFIKTANIGPGWQQRTEPQAADFARLANLDFRHLISAHGAPLLDTARNAVRATIKDQYGV